MNIAVIFGAPGVLLFFGSFSLFFCALKKKIRVEDSRNRVGLGLAYAFFILLFLRLLIESVGGVGMYVFLFMLLAAIAAEANRAFKPT